MYCAICSALWHPWSLSVPQSVLPTVAISLVEVVEIHPSTTAYYSPPQLLLAAISGGSSLHSKSASLRALLKTASVPVAFVDDHGVITVVRIAVDDENVDIRESHAGGGGCGVEVLPRMCCSGG